jgi:hypothetical protein
MLKSRAKQVFGLEQRRQLVKDAYQHLVDNKGSSLVYAAEKHHITESALRAYMRSRKLKNPNGRDYSSNTERQDWIVKAYAEGLELDLTATEVSLKYAELAKCNISRYDIQHYANKFDLPLLRETDNGPNPIKTSKYG